jgi:hypothetical protein
VSAVVFVSESTGLKFAHIAAKVWQVQPLQKSFNKFKKFNTGLQEPAVSTHHKQSTVL